MSDGFENVAAARILVCEDQFLIAEDVAATLRDLGYEIAGKVGTGEEAVRVTEEMSPDLILMDINLAGAIDGIDAADRIRLQHDIPVVYLTAYTENDVFERAKHTQPYGYISKPVGFLELKSTVESALYKHDADRKVRESETRRAKAEELAGFHSWDWEILTGRLGGSEESHRTFGLDREQTEIMLDTFINSVHPDDRDFVERALWDAVDGKRPYDVEFRIVPPNGQERILHSRGEVQRDAEGRPIRMHGMALDITERRTLEAERDRILNMSYDLICVAGMDGYFKYVNPSWKRVLGYTSEELLSRPFLYFIHRDDRLRSVEEVRKLKSGIQTVDFEIRCVHKDGTIRTITWMATPLPERGIFYCIGRDVTDRKKAELALRASEKKYRELFDNSPVGIVSVDTEGRVLEVNRPLMSVMGSPSREASKAINVFELPQLILSGLADAFRICMETGKRVMRDVPYVSKWGKRLHLRVVMTPVRDEKGVIQGCQATLEDVTQNKKLEEQLRQAHKMEAIGTLAGGISHDFNNLLQIITGNAELLEMKLADEGMSFTQIDAIRQATRRGADLVKQILTFSSRVDTKFECINLNEGVRNAERLLFRTIPRMIEIELKLEEPLKPIRADATQIEQVLINLAVNAKDAMPDGGRLTIETRNVVLDENGNESNPDLVPGQYVLLRVSDSGHGIARDLLPHIFEPFFTTRGLAAGTGLGLATVFGIVKMHRGHITCESSIGRGTAFEIYIPAADRDRASGDSEYDAPAVAGGTETILVIDDEDLIRDLAQRILEKSGYSVLTAASGQEGVEIYALNKSEISLVILDLLMPGMDGGQCLQELLKVDPQVKVLIASSFAVEGNAKTFLEARVQGVVPKPLNMRDLLRSVRNVLDCNS